MASENAYALQSQEKYYFSKQHIYLGGGLVKGLSGDVPLKWVAKSVSWYNDDPLCSAKTGKHGSYFQNFLKLVQK